MFRFSSTLFIWVVYILIATDCVDAQSPPKFIPPEDVTYRTEDIANARATGPKKPVMIPEITQYGIYGMARPRAQKEAIDWFDQYLKK